MCPNQLLQRMTKPAGPVSYVRDVPAALAFNLALIADRLTEAELRRFIDIGTVINERTAVMAPELGAVR